MQYLYIWKKGRKAKKELLRLLEAYENDAKNFYIEIENCCKNVKKI